jgi:hypothetical protein
MLVTVNGGRSSECRFPKFHVTWRGTCRQLTHTAAPRPATAERHKPAVLCPSALLHQSRTLRFTLRDPALPPFSGRNGGSDICSNFRWHFIISALFIPGHDRPCQDTPANPIPDAMTPEDRLYHERFMREAIAMVSRPPNRAWRPAMIG